MPHTNPKPHKLALYEAAVQHPVAEVDFIGRAYRHYHRGQEPELLREDFAGGAAVSAAWCQSARGHRQAMAIEMHGPTARWAEKRHRDLEDLHIVEADVLAVSGPRVDVTVALNFSVLIYHDEATLLEYFRHARRGLRPGGMLLMDLYGGPGAMRIGTQTRRSDGFTYHWEQRSFDAITHLTQCRIHFELPGGQWLRSAFVYHWRLWTLPELMKLLQTAGFNDVAVWSAHANGRYRPTRRLPAEESWVVYLSGTR